MPPCNIIGEHHRLVRQHCNLPPFVIMHQSDNWGPFDPIIAPEGLGLTSWDGQSHHNLLQDLLMTLPPSIARCPRPDHRAVALKRALANRHSASLNHETHAGDEHSDMLALDRFFAANPNAVTDCQNHPGNNVPNNDFVNTSIFRANPMHNVPNGAPMPVWVPLAPPNEGVARSGREGLGREAQAFRLANLANPCVAGRTANEVGRGNFNVVGTPRRL